MISINTTPISVSKKGENFMAIKYKWLASRLREQIPDYAVRGQYQLPTEAELAGRYKVSRQTVRQALALLTKEGLIEKRQGSGSYLTGRTRSAEQNIIPILITSDSDYTYPKFLYDLRNELMHRGFSLRAHATGNRLDTERNILAGLLAEPPRALIIEPVMSALPNPNLDLYLALQRAGTHMVFLRYRYPQLRHTVCIREDNIAGGRMLTEYLLTHDHTSIGAFFDADDLAGIERYQGMTETLRDHDLLPSAEHVRWFHTPELQQLLQNNTHFIKKAIQESFASCTAILCHNDLIAYEVVRLLHASTDPKLAEITVVSFDHSYLCHAGLHPFLSLAHPEHAWEQPLAGAALAPLRGLTAQSVSLPWENPLR